MELKKGDVLISRVAHSCSVKFVEAVDDTGILLVNGIKDEFYEPIRFAELNANFTLMCRREDRQDLK